MSQQINLYNPAFEKQKQIFTATTMLWSLSLLLAGVIALAVYARMSVARLEREVAAGSERLAQKKLRQASVLVEFAPKQSDPQVAADIIAAEQEQAGIAEVLTLLQGGALGNTIGYSPYFKALARQSTNDLWLTGVVIDGAAAQIGLQGRALHASVVPGYLARLAREPALRGKAFGSLQISHAVAAPAAATDAAPPPFVAFSLQAVGTPDPAAGPARPAAPPAAVLTPAPASAPAATAVPPAPTAPEASR